MAKKQEVAAQGNDKTCAILSYILIGVIWYFADANMKQSELAKYHAKQGLVLLIADIIYSIILGIVVVPLLILSMGLLAPLITLLYYIPLIWVIIGMINAANGRMKPLPIIGGFGEKFSF